MDQREEKAVEGKDGARGSKHQGAQFISGRLFSRQRELNKWSNHMKMFLLIDQDQWLYYYCEKY